jgi:GNAT superfamily N-acetyltransferase
MLNLVATQHLKPSIRPVTAADAAECGRICYQAFASIAERHGFPADFPSIEVATGMVSGLIAHPGFYGVVAACGGQVVGANFLDERSTIFSVGPVVVDPNAQNWGVGRALMDEVVQRSARLRPAGVRLLQAAYHNRSLSLYTKIGFEVRESFAAMHGKPLRVKFCGYAVRPAIADDATACSELCRLVHGHDRHGELLEAIPQGSAMVVERGGRITGYTTGIGFYSHSVAETDDDVIALIAAADEFTFGAGFLVPLRNTKLMRWCLAHGFQVTYMMNLMSLGLYQEPRGAFLASVGY